METVGGILVFCGAVAFVGGLLSLLFRKWNRPRNKLLTAFAGFMAVGIGGAMLPQPVKAPGAAVAATPAPTALVAKSDAPSAQVRGAFLDGYHELLAAVGPCDERANATGKTLQKISSGRETMIEGYSAARDAHDACDDAWQKVQAISPPDGLPAEVSSKMAKTMETCSNAYFARREGMEAVMAVLDGDNHPSKVIEVRDQLQVAQAGTLMCVAGWFDASQTLGIKLT